MTAQAVALTLVTGVALAMLFAGAATAFVSANIVKRIAGVMIALVGAMLCLAALGAGAQTLVAAVAIALAYCAIGAALLVRVQEAYGEVETPEANKADFADEPREPRS